TPNTAWNSYLQLTLHFPAWFLGFIALVGSLLTFLGIVAYKRYFFKSSWRFIYSFSSIATTLFSCMQLILIFQLNTRYLGISNYPFAMGDDVLYSMLTTFGNIALTVASSMGSWCAKIWDVSNEALKAHQLDGLWKLALLTSLLPIVPLTLLHLLPKDSKQQKQLQKNTERSKVGGVVFLTVLASSLVLVLANAVLILKAAAAARAPDAHAGAHAAEGSHWSGGRLPLFV
ncbi:hypothetical protein TeGR_g6341, partial [Tetraparma gracilis]